MEGLSINVFRGLSIILLSIIVYMLIDSLLNIPLLTLMVAGFSGALVVFACRQMDRRELNMFRASLVMGVIFFIIGNFIVFTERNQFYTDPTKIYIITMGFFLSAIGMIVMFSSIPIIIYKDLEEHKLRSA